MTDKINELDIATTCVRFDNNQQFSGRAYGHTGADTPMGFVWVSIGYQQWGGVAKSDASGSYTFVLPVAVSNVLVATSAIKGWNNTDNNFCWHCVGTTSGPNDIVVTWNCYNAITRISYVGYIALCI